MEKLISIVIPCYNAEKTLARTLNSIREQSYKNLEIIIVNDGSKDSTLELANSFSKMDNRIRVIDQANAGVSVARNNGVMSANGRYIMFLDADDNYTTPFAIANMCKKLEETGSDMCVCNFTHPCFEQYLQGGVLDLTDTNQFLAFFQDFFAYGMPWNKIAKRECYTEMFVPGVKFNEDELFNLDNLHNIKKVAIINEVYHNYYCAPYNPNLPASAVNSIYSEDLFWEKKSTIWHMGMKNHEYRVQSLKKFFPSRWQELQYVRSFDFFFWDFFLMAKNRVKEEHIVATCESIFETGLFQNSIQDKERYGLRLKPITKEEIADFVKLAYNAFIDIKTYNKKLSMYQVFLGLFYHKFYELTNEVDTRDILAKCAMNLKNSSSAEGCYVKALLDIKNSDSNENGCKIFMFEANMKLWRSAETN